MFDFRKWIQSQEIKYPINAEDRNHFKIITPVTVGQINFYDIGEDQDEVVEFKIVLDDESNPNFFLHFQANHEDHAKELFFEFIEALDELENSQVKEILLCCTSAFTTSHFASKLNEEAEKSGMKYSFSAVSMNQIYEAGVGKYAILLAPQISYLQKKLKEVMKDTTVLTIPSILFGKFDAYTYLIELDKELKNTTSEKKNHEIRKYNIKENDKRILVISAFANGDYANIYYRIYDHGKITVNECVNKKFMKIEDIEDIIDTQVCEQSGKAKVDAIGIAIPGIIHEGRLFLPSTNTTDFNHGEASGFAIQEWFRNKYQVPVHVHNNTNCAAIGWYGIQDKYKNIVFYSQPRGWVHGGQGIVVDGKLIIGSHSSAGENKYVMNRFNYSTPMTFNPFNPDDMLQIVCNVLVMDIAFLDPEVICVRSELTPNMDDVKKALSKYIPEDHIPELIYIDDYNEHIMNGVMFYCITHLD